MNSLISKLRDRLVSRPTAAQTALREVPFEQGLNAVDVDSIADIIRQAQAGDCAPLMALYREIIATHGHLQSCFSRRKEAVLLKALTLHPASRNRAEDIQAAGYIAAQFTALEGWQSACGHLLDSILFPVALVEKQFRPVGRPGSGTYELAALVPVPHQLLDLSSGNLRVRQVNALGLPTSESYPADPARYIIHRGHTLNAPDNWGGPMRSLVFWWLFSMTNREGWARFLDRNGAPFLLGKYTGGDDAVRQSLEQAMAATSKLAGVTIPLEADVEIKEVRASNGRVSQRGGAAPVFHAVANAEISKFLLGHDERVGGQRETTGMKERADMRRLAHTLQNQLFAQMLTLGGQSGRSPLPCWGGVNYIENTTTAAALAGFKAGGLRVGNDALPILSERFGFPVERDQEPHAWPVQNERTAHARN